MPFAPVDEILAELRAGRMVVIVDDEDRENEGDLLMLASHVRPEDINFMARYGRGLICLTLTRERCRQINLPLMVGDNRESHGTAFTLSIEAAEGVTTGISAYDRAHTIRTAVAPNARPADIVQPGHVFPLMAQPGGVLVRAGHTEAGCDLARLAGAEPAAVIVEILNEDGSMARRPDLERFCDEHGLKMGTIEDLIRYRVEHERTVREVASRPFPTRNGLFELRAFRDDVDHQLHLALVKGEPRPDTSSTVRVHVEQTLCDTLGYAGESCGWPLQGAMQRIQAEPGPGVVVILRSPDQAATLHEFLGQTDINPGQGGSNVQTPVRGRTREWRMYGVGAQILAECGVGKMRLMSAPKRFHGLAGFGLEVVDYLHD
ncbi:MAG: bifunctional 3,4-dihydroxy-2-butanone-4-phosphate synthase/GTP cyclohydrolase II [Thioalkalivibrionaceae bacterium]